MVGLEYEPENGDVATITKNVTILVKPVNDQPVITAAPQVHAYEEVSTRIDNPFDLAVSDVDFKYGAQRTNMRLYLFTFIFIIYCLFTASKIFFD